MLNTQYIHFEIFGPFPGAGHIISKLLQIIVISLYISVIIIEQGIKKGKQKTKHKNKNKAISLSYFLNDCCKLLSKVYKRPLA